MGKLVEQTDTLHQLRNVVIDAKVPEARGKLSVYLSKKCVTVQPVPPKTNRHLYLHCNTSTKPFQESALVVQNPDKTDGILPAY